MYLSLVAPLYIALTLLEVSMANPVAQSSIAQASAGSSAATAEVFQNPKPYEFGFQMDDGNGTMQHRQEIANENGIVKGEYGYLDAKGTYRKVEYSADENGYHAKILSNEPGISHQNSADVVYIINNESKL